ncbi:bifunctional pantoate--beta-alanine ligase/(d)CMP kinase [Oscillatoria sp. FACHB-1406]|uniref:bifunctional pantoate--beta-alanine ligase/(d)CMP kinase n=1 Tax=Oscillatoria sp. FACHB-1406 TaxID=2692846 RepID=UPI00168927D4|nr:bifunctional pantoate--beta-alanine ligase/(d)CMP kinase [Oscillatoria sp. FACHB-1406]MBD2577822.1 bifunctional pantoate--beta-alanine ligase/(d)CMP kinase [Oscillatoria sp. FACHB-1406]
MRVLKTIAGLQAYLNDERVSREIGLVPTMGALHAGHQRLLERAIAENDRTVATIFVNPLQFSPQEDLEQYPRNLDRDCQFCQNLGVDVVFAPSPEEMGIFPGQNERSLAVILPPADMVTGLCGPFRPGHFAGVATIVTKLLNIVQPTRAYFGEKDAQQLAIIRRLIRDLNIPVEIRACSTVRDELGLALSSRNQYLSASQTEQATILYWSLEAARQAFRAGERDSKVLSAIAAEKLATVPEVQVQYLELVDPASLQPIERIETAGLLAIAAYLGSTRLIDNVILRDRQPIIAIDGPAGAGKSTVTRHVAEALDFFHLNTGAMYRAVTWLVLQAGIDTDDEPAIAELLQSVAIEFLPTDSPTGMQITINQQDVTKTILSPTVTDSVSAVSKLPAVRSALVRQQQAIGKKGGIVAEGRDIGTHVFPDAELKIYLTASERERARRRRNDLLAQGELNLSLEQIEKDIQRRDFLDSTRKIAPLRKAPDAIEIVTDNLNIEEATEAILNCYREAFSKRTK